MFHVIKEWTFMFKNQVRIYILKLDLLCLVWEASMNYVMQSVVNYVQVCYDYVLSFKYVCTFFLEPCLEVFLKVESFLLCLTIIIYHHHFLLSITMLTH